MRRFRNLLIVSLAAASTGCLYGREVVREPRVEAPPPPPSDARQDAQADSRYQTQAGQPPPAGEVVDDETFYSGLSPYGSWTYVAPYGRVWIPAVGYGWRPYYYGRWVLTDWGWTFASDDPWGWAAYHYGRWNWGVGYGWYWVPGNVWGPAWVSWRYGGGYAAWCPLGPSGVIFGYNHPAWVAVQEQHFTRPIPRAAVPISGTPQVVGIAQPLSGPHSQPIARSGAFGPPLGGVQRAVGQPIARVPVPQVTGRPQPSASAGSPAGPTRSPMSPRGGDGSGGDGPRSAQPARPVARPYTGSPEPGVGRARGNSGGVNYGGGGNEGGSSGGGARGPSSGGGNEGGSSGGGARGPSSGGARGGPAGGAPQGGGGGAPRGGASAPAPAAPSAPRGGGPHAGTKTK